MLDTIAQLPDPGKRLGALRTFVLAEVEAGQTLPASKTVLTRCLTMAADAAFLLRDQLPTADASFFHRRSVDDLLRLLNTICIANITGSSKLNNIDGIWSADLSQLSAADRDILTAYERFLFAMSQWMASFYAKTPLCRALTLLSRAERDEYRTTCETIAELYRQVYGLERKSPQRASADQKLQILLDRVRELRSLALCGDAQRAEIAAEDLPNASQAGTARLFCIELASPPDQPLVGFYLLAAGSVTFLISRSLNEQIRPILQIAALFSPSLEAWKAGLRKVTSIGHCEVRDAIVRLGQLHGISNILLTDLTSHKLPWNAVLDPLNAFCWANVGNCFANPSQTSPCAIHQWGDMHYVTKYSLLVDDESRQVSQDGQTLLQYPHVPSASLRVKGFPQPLPFSCYERWFLDDLARSSQVDFVPHIGPSATREQFLRIAPTRSGVLHLTTHGESDVERPECSRLLFAHEAGKPTVVHALDILSKDWSGYELVFLNACRTSHGQRRPGDELLSLAWAFSAAGAPAVIACRWPVRDEVAWQFCRAFYGAWFDGMPLSQAFAKGMRHLCNDAKAGPEDWAAFVLFVS